jgi:hypothetical protein
MKLQRALLFLILVSFLCFPLAAQSDDSGDTAKADNPIDFFITPILETAFSGVHWSPDWPPDIPPDTFSPLKENANLAGIELSNTEEDFVVKRDSAGRLVEFPLFLANGYVKVKASYSDGGALLEMEVLFFANDDAAAAEDASSQNDNSRTTGGASQNGNSQAQGDAPQNNNSQAGSGAPQGSTGQADGGDTQGDKSQTEGKTWTIEFPAGFLPYSDLSQGGTFPPVTVSTEDSTFYVFFFESLAFLSETWYDSNGNMLSFCKALVNSENGSWRIRSLQIHDAEFLRFEDRFFDSGGNITEVRFSDKVFFALYMNRLPYYWQYIPGLRAQLQWDTRETLTIIKIIEETGDLNVEYRYEYERDTDGYWSKRQETAFIDQFDVLAPQPLFSRGVWNRRIIFSAED